MFHFWWRFFNKLHLKKLFMSFILFFVKLYNIFKRIFEQNIKLYFNKQKKGIFINGENSNLLFAKLFYLSLVYIFYLCFYVILIKYSIAIIWGMEYKYLNYVYIFKILFILFMNLVYFSLTVKLTIYYILSVYNVFVHHPYDYVFITLNEVEALEKYVFFITNSIPRRLNPPYSKINEKQKIIKEDVDSKLIPIAKFNNAVFMPSDDYKYFDTIFYFDTFQKDKNLIPYSMLVDIILTHNNIKLIRHLDNIVILPAWIILYILIYPVSYIEFKNIKNEIIYMKNNWKILFKHAQRWNFSLSIYTKKLNNTYKNINRNLFISTILLLFALIYYIVPLAYSIEFVTNSPTISCIIECDLFGNCRIHRRFYNTLGKIGIPKGNVEHLMIRLTSEDLLKYNYLNKIYGASVDDVLNLTSSKKIYGKDSKYLGEADFQFSMRYFDWKEGIYSGKKQWVKVNKKGGDLYYDYIKENYDKIKLMGIKEEKLIKKYFDEQLKIGPIKE